MFLPGYIFIEQNSKTNAGGVGMFVNDFLNYEVIHTYDLNHDECEEIWVKVKINKAVIPSQITQCTLTQNLQFA